MNFKEYFTQLFIGEANNQSKYTKYYSWAVVRTFEGSTFQGEEYWNGKPVQNWCVVQYNNNKWRAIGFYKGTSGYYIIDKPDPYQADWITAMSISIVRNYEDGVLTVRGLHYKLVNKGMINSMTHYSRVKDAMGKARRAGRVSYKKFSDRDRQMESFTNWKETDFDSEVRTAKGQVKAWMRSYSRNRWENQIYYPEIWIEKKALIGAFMNPCRKHDVALAACKGYPSLTFLDEAADRFIDAVDSGKRPVIIYFGDYDPSGDDIPRSIQENLWDDFSVEVDVRKVALNVEQVEEWNLPPAPIKPGDSRSAAWDGIGQVELDAVETSDLEQLIEDSIDSIFDQELYNELIELEEEERPKFIEELKDFVREL